MGLFEKDYFVQDNEVPARFRWAIRFLKHAVGGVFDADTVLKW